MTSVLPTVASVGSLAVSGVMFSILMHRINEDRSDTDYKQRNLTDRLTKLELAPTRQAGIVEAIQVPIVGAGGVVAGGVVGFLVGKWWR